MLADRLLSAHVPHAQLKLSLRELLQVEPLCRTYILNVLVGQFLQDRRLSGVVKAEDKDAGLALLPLGRVAREQVRKQLSAPHI